MAMRTASPWWASLVFGIGLFFILLGERLFGHLPSMRMVMTTIGVIATDVALTKAEATKVAADQMIHRDFYANYGPGQFHLLAWLFDTAGRTVLVDTGNGPEADGTLMALLWAATMAPALIQSWNTPTSGWSRPIWARAFGFVALAFASVNIFGGFLVTQRMLAMCQKKPKR